MACVTTKNTQITSRRDHNYMTSVIWCILWPLRGQTSQNGFCVKLKVQKNRRRELEFFIFPTVFRRGGGRLLGARRHGRSPMGWRMFLTETLWVVVRLVNVAMRSDHAHRRAGLICHNWAIAQCSWQQFLYRIWWLFFVWLLRWPLQDRVN